jgi:hypothetical protein
MVATFRNRLAVFFWVFAVAWMASLLLMTYVFFRDGPPGGSSSLIMPMILVLFWIVGIGLCAFAVTSKQGLVTAGPGNVASVTWRFPFKVVRKSLPAASLYPAKVVASRDSDGDPYFHARVELIDGGVMDIAEGNSRAACKRACERFNALLFPTSPTSSSIAAAK